MSADKELRTNQRRAVWALLTTATIKDAAEEVGVGESTLRRWLKEDDAFAEAVEDATARVVEHSEARAKAAASEAVDTLIRLMQEAHSEHVRIRAALALAPRYIRRRPSLDEDLIDELREQLEGLEDARD